MGRNKNSSSQSNCSTDRRSCSNSSDNSSDSNSNRCSDDCGIREAHTPIGVWNLVYDAETHTTTGTMQWLSQLILNGDKTLNMFAPPDLINNPFGSVLPTPGCGTWNMVCDNKLKLHVVHIAYRPSDGKPVAYVKVKILLKLNRRRNRLRFSGEAQTYDLTDPKMCTPTSDAAVNFTGTGAKVLEPSLD